MIKAIICHSGGMDSSLCLKIAIDRWGPQAVISLGFDYGQRHKSEHTAAAFIAASWGVERQVIPVPILRHLQESALIDHSKPLQGRNSFVPGRNGLFAWQAALFAHAHSAEEVYLGVLERETHYPDCSRTYFDRLEAILTGDLGCCRFVTPLIAMTKQETLQEAARRGVLEFLLEHTVTCYEGLSGMGCGCCLACQLRLEGGGGLIHDEQLRLF